MIQSENNNTKGFSKEKFLIYIGLVGASILSAYVIVNFTLGDYVFAFFEMIMAVLAVISAILVKKRKKYAFLLGSLVVFLISLQNFYFGGFYNTGIFWIFMFPPIIFLMNGLRKGAIWSILLIASMVTLTILKIFSIVNIDYEIFYLLMFFIAFGFVSALVALYQYYYEKYEVILYRNSQILGNTNKKLEEHLDIEKSNTIKNQLEKEKIEKLNELMIGRELKMIELKKENQKLKDQLDKRGKQNE